MTVTIEWWVVVILAILYINTGFIISGIIRNSQGKSYLILALIWPLVVFFITIVSMINTLQNIGKMIGENAQKGKKE